MIANCNIKFSNILYHWQSSMASFRFCETCLLHTTHQTVRGQQECDFSILGRSMHLDWGSTALQAKCRQVKLTVEMIQKYTKLSRQYTQIVHLERDLPGEGPKTWAARSFGGHNSTWLMLLFYSLLHFYCHFFILKSQSMIEFSRSFWPRSIEKRPRGLRLEIEIKWHLNSTYKRLFFIRNSLVALLEALFAESME